MTPGKRRFIITGIVLTISVLVCLFFLMFAFVQKSEADKQLKRAEQQRIYAENCAHEMDQFRIEMEKAKEELAHALKLLEAKQKQEAK